MVTLKNALTVSGIVLFIVGLGYGVHAAVRLSALPIIASDLVSRWVGYIEGFGVSVVLMVIGGVIILVSTSKND